MKKLTVLILICIPVLILTLSLTQGTKSDDTNKSGPQNLRLSNASQEPERNDSQAYQIVLENQSVRVTQVRYEPFETIESHSHPKLPTIYFYLSGSGPVRFTHTGEEKFTMERPSVKTGGLEYFDCKNWRYRCAECGLRGRP